MRKVKYEQITGGHL